jgi:hypothetical protein
MSGNLAGASVVVACRKSTVQCYQCEAMVTYPFTGKKICVDACLIKELFWLWDQGIETGGCCCGNHKNSRLEPTILVQETSVRAMRDLGYHHIDGQPSWWFTPKTRLGDE